MVVNSYAQATAREPQKCIQLDRTNLSAATGGVAVLVPLNEAGDVPPLLQSLVRWNFTVEVPDDTGADDGADSASATGSGDGASAAARTPSMDEFTDPIASSRPKRRRSVAASRGEESLKHTQFVNDLASGRLDPLTMVRSTCVRVPYVGVACGC